MRAPTVSIVIPVLNRFDDLVGSISSIQSQTYDNFEILLGDDGSTEDIAGMVEGFGDERIRLFQFKKKQMPGRTRNIPMRYAEGLYIAFCEPGDVWYPDKLGRQVAFMESNPKTVLVWCNCLIEKADNDVEEELCHPAPVYIKRDPVETLLFDNLIVTSMALLRRNALIVTGLFHERMPLLSSYALWLRIATQGDLYCDHEPGGIIRDARSDQNQLENIEARIHALEDFESWAPKPHHKSLARIHLKQARKTRASLLVKEGKLGKAIRFFLGGKK